MGSSSSSNYSICPACGGKFKSLGRVLEAASEADAFPADEPPPTHFLELLEELRRVLAFFLKTEVLTSLLELSRLLNAAPIYSEQYSFLSRKSDDGGSCKYALLALQRFKERRLDRVEELINIVLPLLPGSSSKV